MRRASWSVAGIIGLAILLGLAAAALPDRPYRRWSSLHGTIFAEARWIYERCRFDPTPIDVAILGTSRSRQGVSAPRLQADLAQSGMAVHVVNLSMVESGRGSDMAILTELLRDKRPKLIIYEIQDYPNRKVHAAYKFLASPGAVAASLAWRNDAYVEDTLYLPYRQMKSFWDGLVEGGGLQDETFRRASYAGPLRETVGSMPYAGTTVENLQIAEDPQKLRQESLVYQDLNERRAKRIPHVLKDLAAADDGAYMARLARLARSHGVPMVFLYIPYFGGPGRILRPDIYAGSAPIWQAAFLHDQPAVWNNIVHLTGRGAFVLTDWLAQKVADCLRDDPEGHAMHDNTPACARAARGDPALNR